MEDIFGQLSQQAINGITIGGVYALIAIGYTMVYGVLSMLNFAHGELYMIGGFTGWWVLQIFSVNHVPVMNAALLISLMILLSMGMSALLGLVIERVAYRPLRNAPRMNLLLSSLGVSIFIQNFILYFQGAKVKVFHVSQLIPETIRVFHVGGVVISFMRMMVIVICFVLMVLLTLVIKKTNIGKSIRATAQDIEAAAFMGIDTNKIIVIVFLIGSALGGAAGILVSLLFTQVDYYVGFQAGLKGFTAAVLGGIGSIPGAMAGGLLLGICEAMAVTFFPSAYKDVVAFTILIMVLIFRPQGLMGEKYVKKFSSQLRISPETATIIFFILSLSIIPGILPNSYWQSIFSTTGIFIMLSLGLNIVAGFTGLLDLSYIAFFGIGGYTFAFLCSDHFGIHLPFLAAVPICALAAMVSGLMLGLTSIRLRGDYLAIVTLAFAQIFKLLLLNLDAPVNITGGVNGIYAFDMIRIFSIKILSPQSYSTLIWICALIVFVISFRLKESRIGRGWNAIREDELAANTIGINTTSMKLYSFATGAMVAGFAGAVFASFQDSVFPNNFDFQQLVIVYCMVIIGGLGNVYGVIAGAVVLSILPEILREYGGLRMMIYGITLVVIMAVRPQGLFSSIPGFTKLMRRPDKDETGKLRASTDLYYSENDNDADAKAYKNENTPLLEIQNLTLKFGGLTAIDDLDFTLHKNEILSIIGPNGAGKSTLFNVISGIYIADEGKVIYRDKDISYFKPYKVAKAGIARTFQNLRLFNELSVIENVKTSRFCRTTSFFLSAVFNLKLNKREEKETDEKTKKILSMFGKRLTGYRYDQKVSQLSYANRRRVEIARAMATDPEILLLDEPSAGMNPQETLEITEFIKQLRDKFGYTILVIEHKLNLVKAVSDRVIVIDHGKKLTEGSYDAVSKNSEVIEAYLGKKGKSGK